MFDKTGRGKVTYHAGFLGPWIIDNSGYPRTITIKGKKYTANTLADVAKIQQKVEDEANAKIEQAKLAKSIRARAIQDEKIRKAQARVKQIPELTLHANNPLPRERLKPFSE